MIRQLAGSIHDPERPVGLDFRTGSSLMEHAQAQRKTTGRKEYTNASFSTIVASNPPPTLDADKRLELGESLLRQHRPGVGKYDEVGVERYFGVVQGLGREAGGVTPAVSGRRTHHVLAKGVRFFGGERGGVIRLRYSFESALQERRS